MVEAKTERTRERILQAAYDEIYEHGYQGMRIDAILKKTGLAKGALYHHFPNKKELGYAIVDEVLYAQFLEMKSVLEQGDSIITNLCELLKHTCSNITDKEVSLGCPLNNLSQEMSGLDEGFKNRLSNIYQQKSDLISHSLKKGQQLNTIRKDIDPTAVAGFIISSVQGIIGAAKCMQDKEIFSSFIDVLCDYLHTLEVNTPD